MGGTICLGSIRMYFQVKNSEPAILFGNQSFVDERHVIDMSNLKMLAFLSLEKMSVVAAWRIWCLTRWTRRERYDFVHLNAMKMTFAHVLVLLCFCCCPVGSGVI
ncbi:uncharacterized protein LOC107009230 [Solanum pennellii]|uniref:Uncharacterized protein LOC107009230 n=1 Tax=Solanum pennellii TaxID=28526 RepID=A0ABM1V549_SOLPN|nr:uncharacterized protein LOC107009230 [Solanum pennellii]